MVAGTDRSPAETGSRTVHGLGRGRATVNALTPRRERLAVALLAAVQFTHVVDFMVIMPLGPQFMRVLGVLPHEFALLVAAYTFGAAASAVAAAFVIDRFDRRHAMLVVYAGLLVSTLLCAVVPSFAWLVAARVVAGVFGGIAGAMVHTIAGDLVPDARRGAATGVIASSFPLAAIAGVPAGLALGNAFDWRATFVAVGLACALVWVLLWRSLPSVRTHLHGEAWSGSALNRVVAVLRNPNHLRAYALMAALMFAGFSVIPFISPYMVSNVGVQETDLPLLYLCGGTATLISSRLIGLMADRHGKVRVFRWVASASVIPLLLTTHLPPVPVPVAIGASMLFMVLVSGRFIPVMALVNGAAEPRLRGAFLSVNSAIQQCACGLAALGAGLVMGNDAQGRITHYGTVGFVAVAATLLCLWLAGRVRVTDAQ
jgi:predicted MFS family arabinose efflux permease